VIRFVPGLKSFQEFGPNTFSRGKAWLAGIWKRKRIRANFVGKGYLKITFDRGVVPGRGRHSAAPKVIQAKGLQVTSRETSRAKAPKRDVVEWIDCHSGRGSVSLPAAAAANPAHELLIEESVIGWKGIQMEVVRDRRDNCIIVCSIENVDSMACIRGFDHRGAAQTLRTRIPDHARCGDPRCCAIAVDTGGLERAIRRESQKTGALLVIEMNPRVSRSSALRPRRRASRSRRWRPAGGRITRSMS